MRVVVVGSGGREHAWAQALSEDCEVVVTPGNEGMTLDCEISGEDPEDLRPDLVVIGPDEQIVGGLADRLSARGVTVLGPGSDGAVLEGSKAAMKEIVSAAGVPSARYRVARDYKTAVSCLDDFGPPYVIKTDKLAAGKGVLVTNDRTAALKDVREKLSGETFGGAGRTLVIEEPLYGQEISVFALVNGKECFLFPVARDHKRLGTGDTGPNTGGMGALSPVPGVDASYLARIKEEILDPTLEELLRRRIVYRGILYAGLMMTQTGPSLVEYNVRFGDPEAQAVLPRLGKGLGVALRQAARGESVEFPGADGGCAVTVVLASEGYPYHPVFGAPVTGIERARAIPNVLVTSAGLRRGVDGWETSGGRVLGVTGRGGTLKEARALAYHGASYIEFEGMQMRDDIGIVAR